MFGPIGCCVTGTRPQGPGNQGGHVGTCWARCVRARSGGARSPAPSSPNKQTRSNFRGRVETPSLAQPHHTQFGGEHTNPRGAGGPGATLTTPHMGYRFHRAGPWEPGVDHALGGGLLGGTPQGKTILANGVKAYPTTLNCVHELQWH